MLNKKYQYQFVFHWSKTTPLALEDDLVAARGAQGHDVDDGGLRRPVDLRVQVVLDAAGDEVGLQGLEVAADVVVERDLVSMS